MSYLTGELLAILMRFNLCYDVSMKDLPQQPITHYRLAKSQSPAGIAMSNAKSGETVKILARATFTSDDPEFYKYIEQFSNEYLNRLNIQTDGVHHFLIVIHKDTSADIYINHVPMSIEARTKRKVAVGQNIMMSGIADIRKLDFPDAGITDTDKIIFCTKVGWRFGLFFDFTAGLGQAEPDGKTEHHKLNTENMRLDLGKLHRSLAFYDVYKTIESKKMFGKMLKDGWFPFIEVVGAEYTNLYAAYETSFNRKDKIKAVTDKFDRKRINEITERWWDNPLYKAKKKLIQAGLAAYLEDTQQGFISCIKNLNPEIEGILRAAYLADKGPVKKLNTEQLINHIIEKASSSSSQDSLLLPTAFLIYLRDVLFANFDITKGTVEISRHSASHGVADAKKYTKARALQTILVIDQLYFYTMDKLILNSGQAKSGEPS